MLLQVERNNLTAKEPWEKAACIFLIAGSLIYYWSVFFYYAINAGQADDFVDVLWFLEIFLSREHWQDWFAVIALPNHEHVTIFNHLVYLLDYALFKQVNFFHYMMIGHLIVLASCMVLAEWMQKLVGWWYALALAFGLFLNLFYWHASFWAMTAISNQAVVLFALLAARSFSLNNKAIGWPLGWAMLAVIVQFNGLLVLPALIASSLVVSKFRFAYLNRRQLVVWLSFFLVTTAGYILFENPFAHDHLWHYVNYTDPDHLNDYIKPTSGDPNSVHHAFSSALLAFLAMCGASIFNLESWLIAVITGGFLLVSLLYCELKSRVKLDAFWWAMFFFGISSVVLVAVGRGSAFGPEAGLLYRYRLYSFLLLILLAHSLLRWKPSKAIFGLLLACFLVQVSSLAVLDDIKLERDNIKVSHYNWLVDGGMGRTKMPFYPHNQDLRLFNAYEQGYYNPYEAVDSQHKPFSVTKTDIAACLSAGDMQFPELQTIKGWSKKARALAVEIVLDVMPTREAGELLLCSNNAAYVLTFSERNINRPQGKYWPILVLKKQLPPSQYLALWRDGASGYTVIGNIIFP